MTEIQAGALMPERDDGAPVVWRCHRPFERFWYGDVVDGAGERKDFRALITGGLLIPDLTIDEGKKAATRPAGAQQGGA
jgi:hypothetical protein